MSESIDGGPPQDGRGPNKWPDLGSDALCEAPRRYTLLKGKRNLVTGADGFIGSYLTGALVGKGAGVFARCQYNSFNHWGWLEDLVSISQIEVVSGVFGWEPRVSLVEGLRRIIQARLAPPSGVQEAANG